jgi:hypothetical protein
MNPGRIEKLAPELAPNFAGPSGITRYEDVVKPMQIDENPDLLV